MIKKQIRISIDEEDFSIIKQEAKKRKLTMNKLIYKILTAYFTNDDRILEPYFKKENE